MHKDRIACSVIPCGIKDGAFIFVSYAHQDSARVFSIIERLHAAGYAFWYDEGITIGSTWTDEIAAAIMKSQVCLIFLSKNAVESPYVRAEIEFALSRQRKIIPVYLDGTEALPPGLALGLGTIQGILDTRDSGGTVRKIRAALECGQMPRQDRASDAPPTHDAPRKIASVPTRFGVKAVAMVIGGGVAAAIAVAAVLFALPAKSPDLPGAAKTDSEETARANIANPANAVGAPPDEPFDEPKSGETAAVEALNNKGAELLRQGKFDAAIAVFDDADRRFGQDASPAVRTVLANALEGKGVALHRQGETDAALAICDELDRRFGQDTSLPTRFAVVQSLVRIKADILFDRKRYDEAIEVYEDIDRRFGQDDLPGTREQVARSLINKGGALSRQGKSDAAIVAFEETDRRFGQDPSSGMRRLIAVSLVNKGMVLAGESKRAAAVAAFEEVERRFSRDPSPDIREQVALARENKARMDGSQMSPCPNPTASGIKCYTF
ncbi:MAG: TIR domain-containing protein [Zoogloeaceae bacterium]|jgi:tetratricopeptide (TPR) repeat protein|nr:TIR domain-containing protein [Zoogloeaceae bacterium]